MRTGQNLKLLYIEDDEIIRSETLKQLGRFCPNITAAANGEEGLEVYQTDRFDLVLTDIMMPKMDGLKMIKVMKELRPEQLFVVISAYDNRENLTECINLGVNHFLHKPYTFRQLLDAVFMHEDIEKLQSVGQEDFQRGILVKGSNFDQLKREIHTSLNNYFYRHTRYGQPFSALLIYHEQGSDIEKYATVTRQSDAIISLAFNMTLIVFEMTTYEGGFKAAQNVLAHRLKHDLKDVAYYAYTSADDSERSIDIPSHLLVVMNSMVSEGEANVIGTY
jgi:YesN/AraC family two-component response regulator